MRGRIFSFLSLLQLGSLTAALIFIFVMARLVHHRTGDVFVPFWNYVGSIQIAFPPLAILIITYCLAFLGGMKLSDVPSQLISYLRNKFFQSTKLMMAFISGVGLVTGFGLLHTETTPPPKYEQLVSAILAGEIDRSEESLKLLSDIKKKNGKFADQIALVQRVFELRRKINLDAKNTDLVNSRLLLRALTNSDDPNWVEHPLRKHGLAEANLLLAEAIGNAGSFGRGFGNLDAAKLFNQAIQIYKDVRDKSPRRLGTSQLIASAQNNIGNAYFYQRNYEAALLEWQRVIQDYPEHKNVGTLANMIAANIVLGKVDEAVELGEKSREWAEQNGKAIQDTAHYVSILVNTGFAYITKSEIASSIPLFQFAALIEEDDNTKLNLAMAYSMSGDIPNAERILRQVSSPMKHTEISGGNSLASEKRCSYLWWALYSPHIDGRDVAANLFVFLNEKYSADELQVFKVPSELSELRKRVASSLPRFPGNCATYSLMKPIVAFVRGD